jgi:dTMP kinase
MEQPDKKPGKTLFIAFEGIDGSGKSTQVALLAAFLESLGHRVYITMEPTDSPIGTIIRNVFTGKYEADHRTIAGLFVADRLNHLLSKTDGILMKLGQGYTVITDRYYFSSYAYQGAHMPLDWVIHAHSLSAEILRPDLNIFLDITPETSMERIRAGRNSTELYETLENLTAVRNKYFEAFEKLKSDEKIFITNGNRPQELIAFDIREALISLKRGG